MPNNLRPEAFLQGVDVKVRVTCMGATIERLTIEAQLQRLDGKKWTPVGGMLDTSDITPAASGKTYTRVPVFPCSQVRPGDKFRTAGRARDLRRGAGWISNMDLQPRERGRGQVSIEFVEEPGSDDPREWELTPEWRERWSVLCERFAAKADELGGSSVIGALAITLIPPYRGQQIRMICAERQSALVEVNGLRYPRIWELDDAHNGADLEPAVYALMEHDTVFESRVRLADRDPDDPTASVVSYWVRWSAWSRT